MVSPIKNPTPPKPLSGRGAHANETGRFETERREAFDDGWAPDEVLPRKTEVTRDSTRTIIARNQSLDVPFDRSINPYRGCEHGCSYCFARPTHAFLGLSAGLDFETRLFAKPDAAALLEHELRAKSYRPAPLAMGTNTDPYQPIERTWRITRSVLEVLDAFSHPCSIVTKSNLILRDLDLLAPMAARRLFKGFLSVTTLDRSLARLMEPRAATPVRRLEAVRGLAEAGVPVGVMFAPVIPGLNDHELESIAEAAAKAGASSFATVLLRMPLEVKDVFQEWLERHVPDRANRVLSLMRQLHGGQDYDPRWFERGRGHGPVAELINRRADHARACFGLNRPVPSLDTSQFRLPPRFGDQLTLF